MDKIRVGIIGIGGMGGNHAKSLSAGEVPKAELTAVCDIRSQRLDWAKSELKQDVKVFDDADAFFAADCCDAVIVATPHYDHSPLGIRGFEHNLHVLIEKPAGVYTKQVREINEVAAKSDKVFGIMYNQRTRPVYQALKKLIDRGELGEIRRTNWIITSWYRPQSYFDSGGWRATWSGEGGGVLLNQCPHQLDLWQWICGVPSKVRAFMEFGKYHNIEVEDDVTAYVEYPNGATGVFITSTADTPGSNRLEITGNNGRVVVEGDTIIFDKLDVPERQFNAEYTGGFGSPGNKRIEVPVDHDAESGHEVILRNWVEAILNGEKLIAPGEEGINGLSISNAMHLSSWTDASVEIPVDEDAFLGILKERIEKSTFVKHSDDTKTMDVKHSF